MLALVAPSSMTADQQEMWLCAAVDALQGIYASEVREVSAEVRRSVIRHNQIIPEIAKLVAEKRARSLRISELEHDLRTAKAIRVPVMDRRGKPMSEEDTAELNQILENMGATARYRPDGSRYLIDSSSTGGR
jgi:hypothetical protein